MLEDFGVEETLECRCSDCGGTEDKEFKQKASIDNFPKFLIIQLVRFASMVDDERWWSNKIKTAVEFPLDNLDMNKFYPNHSKDQQNPVYELFAVVNHQGSVNGGHYWAFVKTHDNEWYNFNDHSVKIINPKDVQSSDAYMLMYRKKS